MIQTKTTSRVQAWNLNLRNKVGDSVTHLDSTWINVTGKNSEPTEDSLDWELATSNARTSRPLVTVFGNEFVLVKHPNNLDPDFASEIENNDMITEGWAANDIYWPRAICLDDTDIDNLASWDEDAPLEEITLI